MAGLVVPVAMVAAACGGDDSSSGSSDTTAGGAATSAAGSEAGAAPEGGGTYAIVLPSSKEDKSFSQVGYEGLVAGAEAAGGETLFLENVQVASAEESFRNLAAQGPDVVIGLGGQFADAIAAVAPEFPDVHFVGINGTQTGDNLSKWSLSEGEAGYIGGMAWALTHPDSTKIARVAGIEIAPLKFATAGFADGAHAVNPAIGFESVFTGDMDDVAKAKEATLAAFGGGAELILTGMNNAIVGQEQAAEESGGLLLNNNVDKCADAATKDIYFGAAITDTTFAVQSVVEGVADGSLKAGFSKSNITEDEGFKLVLCRDTLTADQQAKIDDAREQLGAGTIKVGLEPAAS